MTLLILSFYFTPDFCAGSFRSQALVDAIHENDAIDSAILLTTMPQRYGHMEGVKPLESLKNIFVKRFLTPEHNNVFLKQVFAYFIFASKAFNYAFTKRKSYNIVFSTSSRLGTGFLGYLVSKATGKPLYLDIRDIFSDNLSSLPFFNNFIGRQFVTLFKKIEIKIISHAKWVNFVSSGFSTYPHIRSIRNDYHLFTNGIDNIFIKNRENLKGRLILKQKSLPINILYAGNIGYGQGLEKIVIPVAKHFHEKIIFQLIGDGSSANLIKKGIIEESLTNVNLSPPVNRDTLLDYYNNADLFFLQLNDIPAFRKVLPSKIFDYGSFDIPMIAGVKGVANSFIKENLPSSHLFNPGDAESVINFINKLISEGFPQVNNDSFSKLFSRRNIMKKMLKSIYSA